MNESERPINTRREGESHALYGPDGKRLAIEPKQRQTGLKIKGKISSLLKKVPTALGLIAAVVIFIPRVTITVSEPVDPNDPLSSSITIQNNGYLPLSSVMPTLVVKQIAYGPPENPVILKTETGGYDMAVKNMELTPIYLGLDDKKTYIMSSLFAGPPNLVRASIAISVEYRIPIVGMPRSKLSRLDAARQRSSRFSRDRDGGFHWYAEAPN